MGNEYNGEENLGQARSSGSSSMKEKKSSKSNKPKIPQRGMGIAELEKLRLGSQSGFTCLPYPQCPFCPNEHLRIQEAHSSPPISYASTYNGLGYYQRLLMGMEDPDYYHSFLMGMKDLEGGNIRYADSQFNTTASWIPGNGMLENQQFAEPGMTRQDMSLPVEGANKKRKVVTNDSVGGSSSQHSGTTDAQEVDLELKLSL